jgi:DNA repair exonuclease SbcCD ATPase subunit
MSQQIREKIAQLEQQQAELKTKLEQTEQEEKFAAKKQEHQELKAAHESSHTDKFPQVIRAIEDLQKLVQAQLVPAAAYKNFCDSGKNYEFFTKTKLLKEVLICKQK